MKSPDLKDINPFLLKESPDFKNFKAKQKITVKPVDVELNSSKYNEVVFNFELTSNIGENIKEANLKEPRMSILMVKDHEFRFNADPEIKKWMEKAYLKLSSHKLKKLSSDELRFAYRTYTRLLTPVFSGSLSKVMNCIDRQKLSRRNKRRKS